MAKKVDHEERKREIAMKAMALFSKVGFDNVTLGMIASATGIARTVLYRYFSTKRDVLDAAIHEGTKRIMEKCAPIVDSKASAAKRLEAVCHTTSEVFFENKDFLIAVYDYAVSQVRIGVDVTERVALRTAGIRNIFRELLNEGRRKGEFSRSLDVAKVSDMLFSYLESATMRLVLNTERTPKAVKSRFSALIDSL